jgi:hypothetical protein
MRAWAARLHRTRRTACPVIRRSRIRPPLFTGHPPGREAGPGASPRSASQSASNVRAPFGPVDDPGPVPLAVADTQLGPPRRRSRPSRGPRPRPGGRRRRRGRPRSAASRTPAAPVAAHALQVDRPGRRAAGRRPGGWSTPPGSRSATAASPCPAEAPRSPRSAAGRLRRTR